MPEQLANVFTQATFAPAVQLGPVNNCRQITFVGLTQPFLAKIYKPVPSDPNKFVESETIEYPANGGDGFEGASGVAFADAIPGQHAQIYARLAYATDPISLGPSVTSAFIDSSGQLAPVPNLINGVIGVVDSGGVPISGTAYTITHLGTGMYLVNFVPSLSVAPVPWAIAINGSLNVSVDGPGINNMTVVIVDLLGNPADSEFSFGAVLPQ